jgi:hypothetical protein
MEDFVNLITLLGAAVGSEEFFLLLSQDPLKAARSLNMILTEAEVDQLNETFGKDVEDDKEDDRQRKQDLHARLVYIRAMLCKKPPCPTYVVAVPYHPIEERKVA